MSKRSRRRKKMARKRKHARRMRHKKKNQELVHRDPIAEALIYKSGDGVHRDKKKEANKRACREKMDLLDPT